MRIPVRLRLTTWYVALLAVIVAALGGFLVVRLRADLTGGIDRELGRDAAQIAVDYGKEGVPEFADSAGTVLGGERPAAQLLDAQGSVLAAFGDRVAGRPMLRRGDLALRTGITRRLGAERFRLLARRARHGGRDAVVVVGQSLAPVDRSVRRVETLLLIAGPAALVATALGGWWLARRALAPVERMTATAGAIGVDRLAARVPEPGTRDEIDHLARTLNTMLDRIEGGVEAQHRLVADASHELRTPLAAMRAEIDVSLRADDLPPAARDVLASAREEVDRLSRTVDDLLTLATLDEAGPRLLRRPLELAGLAREVARGLAAMAAGRGVRVEVTGGPVSADADPDALAHALRNVVENAVGFSPAGATVCVSVAAAGGRARVTVADEGPGIPADARERVFDRFFRLDPSRTRATGGSGLGLAITRELVLAHGGGVRVEDAAGGARVTLELPLSAGEGPQAQVVVASVDGDLGDLADPADVPLAVDHAGLERRPLPRPERAAHEVAERDADARAQAGH